MPRRNRSNRRKRNKQNANPVVVPASNQQSDEIEANSVTPPQYVEYPSFSFDSAIPETSAVKRLMRDMCEVQREELDTISACPLDEDLLEWHVNMTNPDGPYDGVYIHCVMNFPLTYPNEPPKVRLLTSISHPNVMNEYVCISMLTSFGSTRRDEFEGWSSAYSVASILFQLQSFFFAENIRQESGWFQHAVSDSVRVERAKEQARVFECEKCGHTHDNPRPYLSLRAKNSRCANEEFSRSGDDGEDTEAAFDKWIDLPSDCCLVMLQFLDSVSLYCASWTTREWFTIIDKYNLEARHAIRCFHTKLAHTDCILGFGFRRLGCGNYTSQMDYLSQLAWEDGGVREDVWGSRLDLFIPLIINRSHAGRVMDSLRACLKKVDTNPVFAVAKLMNDIVVVLAKNVVRASDSQVDVSYDCRFCGAEVREHWTTCHACEEVDSYGIGRRRSEKLMEMNMSEKALLGYASLHHMLLYLVETDEKCAKTVQRVVNDLVAGRLMKHETRDLGQALAIVTASENAIVWRDIAKSFTVEGWIRKVRWFTQTHPSWNSPNECNYRDVFEHGAVSHCLVLFQIKFLSLVAGGNRKECLSMYNRRCGRPSRKSILKLREFCGVMTAMMINGSFAEKYRFYWKQLGFRTVSANDFIFLLRRAVQTSSKRRYHRPDMSVWHDWKTPRDFHPMNLLIGRSSEDDEKDRLVEIEIPYRPAPPAPSNYPFFEDDEDAREYPRWYDEPNPMPPAPPVTSFFPYHGPVGMTAPGTYAPMVGYAPAGVPVDPRFVGHVNYVPQPSYVSYRMPIPPVPVYPPQFYPPHGNYQPF